MDGETFLAQIDRDDSCWRSAAGSGRYSIVTVDGVRTTALRHAWRLEVGEVPEGRQLLRGEGCELWCCRPDHAYLGVGRKRAERRVWSAPLRACTCDAGSGFLCERCRAAGMTLEDLVLADLRDRAKGIW